MIIVIILLVLLLILALRIVFEVTHPEITRYSVHTDKITESSKVRILFLTDLHERQYGKDNIRLIRMVTKTRPDFILLGGDMVTATLFLNRNKRVVKTIEALSYIAPVYYAPGNHEMRLSETGRKKDRFEDLMFELECMDVAYLNDQRAILTEEMYVHGLNIDERFYSKFGKEYKMTPEYIREKLGTPDQRKFNILLAHNPKYFNTYVQMGYDLVLCGHYHGGIVNVPKYGPLISPDLKFFPDHAAGAYKKSGTIVIVSKGAGAHLINVRLFNRPEVVVVDIVNDNMQ